MVVSVSFQAYQFVLALAFGVCIGIFYDLFRIFRLIFIPGKIAVFFQDIIFLLLSACATFVFLFQINYGDIRFYLAIGIFGGLLFYYLTIGKAVFSFVKMIVFYVKSKLRAFYRRVLNPFLKFLTKILKKEVLFLKKLFHFQKKECKIESTIQRKHKNGKKKK